MTPEVTKIVLSKSILKTFGSKMDQYYKYGIEPAFRSNSYVLT
jgi:hypothetical protein